MDARFICSGVCYGFLKNVRHGFLKKLAVPVPGTFRRSVPRLRIMLGTILIIILILLLIGALPTWPYSNGCGYYPGGGLGLILVIVIVLVLIGRI